MNPTDPTEVKSILYLLRVPGKDLPFSQHILSLWSGFHVIISYMPLESLKTAPITLLSPLFTRLRLVQKCRQR